VVGRDRLRRYDPAAMRFVEIYSATDPENVANRQVWYWAEFEGEQTPRSTEWEPIHAWARGICDRYSDAGIVDRSDKGSGFLRSLIDTESKSNAVGDHYFRHPNGVIIVREERGNGPWLVTWLPDDVDSPSYPGFTLTSTTGEVPEGPTAKVLAEWAATQPWIIPPTATSKPLSPDPIADVPRNEWAELQRKAFEHQATVAFTREPDGSFSYGVYSADGELLQHGVADTWDDARLGMIENLYPPGPEDAE
jgi:hypothetical protein